PETHTAAHDNVHKRIAGGEVLVLDASRVDWILISRNAGAEIAGALEITKGRAAARVEQRLYRSILVLRRVMDLRDVEHRGDAVVELAQPSEQLVDIHILRPVYRSELVQDVFVISDGPARRARPVVDEYSIGEVAAKHGLELMMVRIDETRHHDAPGCVDYRPVHLQIFSDGDDFPAFDHDVALGKVADGRGPRHERTRA